MNDDVDTDGVSGVMNDTTKAAAANASASDTSADVLGGSADNTSTVAATPGKAARKSHGEKRDYTPRGTTYWCRRVILLNGKPVGRGRPTKDGKGDRRVVYVPVDMEYDSAVHGEGVKYNSHSHSMTHKRIPKDSVNYTFDDGVVPAKTKAAKTKAAKGDKSKTAKTTKPAKGKPAKGKPAKGKPAKGKPAKDNEAAVPVPVADVAAPADVNAVPSVDISVSTDAVTA